MIPASTFAYKDVGVFGMARTGIAAVRALTSGAARVYAWDDKDLGRDEAASAGAALRPWSEWPWEKLDAVVLSPGVPLTHPAPHAIVERAHAAGVEVIGDMEVFARELAALPTSRRAPVIAITGTNGKSTTTALIGHILQANGFDAQVGGNIGKAVLELEPPSAKTVYVLEVSSYQIDLSPGLTPDVAVLTNISPDHLDRHGSLENYAAIKARLLRQTAKDGQIVVGVDDRLSSAIFTKFSGNGRTALPVSVGKVLGRGAFVVDGMLYDGQLQRAAKVMDIASAASLPGAHNWQNAALAFAATRPFIKSAAAIAEAIASFPGLAHRMEDVGRMGNVRFINDSKATNADAAARALDCYPDIFWIAGGRAKEGGIVPLARYFPRIRKAYLIGEAAPDFQRTLEGLVPSERCSTLDKAVAAAADDARRSGLQAPVVLLSPACASFDQFQDFEARGEAFRKAVVQLAREPVRETS